MFVKTLNKAFQLRVFVKGFCLAESIFVKEIGDFVKALSKHKKFLNEKIDSA